MTRKRFIKLMMVHNDRNIVNKLAKVAICLYGNYKKAWDGYNIGFTDTCQTYSHPTITGQIYLIPKYERDQIIKVKFTDAIGE